MRMRGGGYEGVDFVAEFGSEVEEGEWFLGCLFLEIHCKIILGSV